MISFSDFKSTRLGLVWLLALLILIVSFATRVALLIKSLSQTDFTVIQIFGTFSLGTFFDLAEASFFVIPFLLYMWLLPEKKISDKLESVCGIWHFLHTYFTSAI